MPLLTSALHTHDSGVMGISTLPSGWGGCDASMTLALKIVTRL